MASNPIDSVIFKDQYSTENMRKIFSDEEQIQSWLDTWVALAQAEAKEGIIPQKAADEIKAKAHYEDFDTDEIRAEIKKTSHPLMPQIKYLTKLVSPEAGKWIHWGATTQDIIDTGLMIQSKKAQELILKQSNILLKKLLQKAEQYKSLVMTGRTNTQQAVPITLGYKFAVWADQIGREIQEIKKYIPTGFVGELGGAAGSLASLNGKGQKVRNEMCHLLNLSSPTITWHVARDRFATIASLNVILAGTVGEIANQIMLSGRNEIDEFSEGFKLGKISSSTMPQKRNPMICDQIMQNVHLAQNEVSIVYPAMILEDERDVRYYAEENYISEIFLYISAALVKMNTVLDQLQINQKQIQKNLNLTHGLIVSEQVMLYLGEKLGRQVAHQVLYEDAQTAISNDQHLLDVLKKDKRVINDINEETLEILLKPENYVGECEQMVEKVINKWS